MVFVGAKERFPQPHYEDRLPRPIQQPGPPVTAGPGFTRREFPSLASSEVTYGIAGSSIAFHSGESLSPTWFQRYHFACPSANTAMFPS